MARTVRQVMTHELHTITADSPIIQAAREMRDGDVGDVLIADGDKVAGIITDRDIVLRGVAEGVNPDGTSALDIATTNVVGIEADQSAHDAAELMRAQDIRRLLVTDGGRPIGIVSIGDLAVELDTDSALADISAGSPNN